MAAPTSSLMFSKASSQFLANLHRTNTSTLNNSTSVRWRNSHHIRSHYHVRTRHHPNDSRLRRIHHTSSAHQRPLAHRRRRDTESTRHRIQYVHTSSPSLEVHFDTHHLSRITQCTAFSVLLSLANHINHALIRVYVLSRRICFTVTKVFNPPCPRS